MALRDRIRSALPFGAAPNDTSTDLALGTTPTAPTVQDMPRPSADGPPLGQSGRGNFYGLPQTDEINRRLIGIEGLRRFDEMYWTDPHIRRLVLMAWAPIVAGTWTLEPHGGDDATDLDREVAETIWWALNEFMSPNLFEHLGTLGPVLLRSGFCPFEQIWTTTTRDGKTLTVPRKLDLRLPRSVWKWWQDDFGDLTHIAQILPSKADVVIPATELVYYRLAPEGDNWQGMSLLRHCYKPYMMKDKLERLQVIGIEHAATGVPVVYPPSGADADTKQKVERILANMHIGDATYIMMPGPKAGSQGSSGVPNQEWLVDVVQYDSSGSNSAVEAALTYHKQGIESSFAQDFMALGQHQVGARATAEVQEDPYLTAVDGLAQTGAVPPLNKLVARIAEVNWGDKIDGPPTFNVALHDNASLSEIAGYLQALVAAEVIQPDSELEDWVRDHADMPPANAQLRVLREQAQIKGLQDTINPPEPTIDPATGMAVAGNTAKPIPSVVPGQQPAATPAAGAKPAAKPAPAAAKPAAKPGAPPASANPKKPSSAAKTLEAPTAKWFERLLSQDRLREAFDGARDNMQTSCAGAVASVARQQAHQAANGTPMTNTTPPSELVDALAAHYEALYHLGGDTVNVELAKQRQALKRTLDDPADTAGGAGAAGKRLVRARQRGEHSARNIIAKINERLGRDQITALKDPQTLQTGAEQAATGQLRLEALSNTAASINDGRTDAAMSSGDVVGGYVTSVMDERSCDPCIAADDGTLLSPDDAIAYGPPNPMCEGKDFCRCAIVWVLSDDPAALSAVT